MDLIDKTLLFFTCLAIYILEGSQTIYVVPCLISLFTILANTYIPRAKTCYFLYIGYLLGCLFYSPLLFFLPVVCYDFFIQEEKYWQFGCLIPLVGCMQNTNVETTLLVLILLVLSLILRRRTSTLLKIKKAHLTFQDESRELSMKLAQKNKDLMANQDYEIHVATLNERNRIAREIHDHVGHMLSRCLLQIGALLVINQDETVKEGLLSIKETLSESMDSIRQSVHDLHDESIDLYNEIKKLVDDFSFCSIKLDYDIASSEQMDKNIKYTLIAIIKEGLSNIIKHSNATQVQVILREHPALYQLIIEDDGTNVVLNSENGIGLTNIADRVEQYNGHLHIKAEDGFQIFISIPKEVN